MGKLTLEQRKLLGEFFINFAVAWLSAGVIAPFFLNKKFTDFIFFSFWGLAFAVFFVLIGLNAVKKIKL